MGFAKQGLLLVPIALITSACGGIDWSSLYGGKYSGLKGGDVCAVLEEQACLTTPGCELVYAACPMCMPDSDCPPCDSEPRCQKGQQTTPPTLPGGKCGAFDESTCLSHPECFPEYVTACTDGCSERTPDGNCSSDCVSYFAQCHDNAYPPPPPADYCNGLDERSCNMTSGCMGIYSGQCPPCDDVKGMCYCDQTAFAFSHCTMDKTWCDGPYPASDGGYPAYDAGGPDWGWGDAGYPAYDGGGWYGNDAGSPNGGRDGGW